MNKDLYVFNNIRPSSLVEEAFAFDPKNLGQLQTVTVSQYVVALAQYLVFFKSETNKTKAEIAKKKGLLDSSLSMSLTPDILKKYKTKTAATEYLLNTVADLTKLNEEITNSKQELIHLEGMDKVIGEFIAAFKRELSRREQELFTIRAERRM